MAAVDGGRNLIRMISFRMSNALDLSSSRDNLVAVTPTVGPLDRVGYQNGSPETQFSERKMAHIGRFRDRLTC